MNALISSTGLTALLAIGLGGAIFEHSLIDRACSRKPDIVQPRKGGIDRKMLWIPAHTFFEIVLLVAPYLAWGNADVRNALLVALPRMYSCGSGPLST